LLTVKSSKKNLITFPENLLDEIGIKEGEEIDIRVRKGSIIILKKTEGFFALEGALKDSNVKNTLKELDKAWKKWKPLESL
jgi:bifunctional DNA-binding transcriptional regulator/antitoxin component of YhaV-PrlF toxin-antitoxin module